MQVEIEPNIFKKEYTIKEINRRWRWDDENKISYDYQEKNQYLASKAENEIQVMGEMPISAVITNLQSFDDFFELYNNDNDIAVKTIAKIHKWLSKNNLALLCSFGHLGKNRCGVIVATHTRLLLVEFRDSRMIRPTKQIGIEPLKNDEFGMIEALSEDKTPDLYMEYIEKLKKGEKISIEEVKTKKEEMSITSVDFLDE